MVRFQPIALLGLAATFTHVDAFVPSVSQRPTRVESSLWYVDPSELHLIAYGGFVVRSRNATTGDLFPSCQQAPIRPANQEGGQLVDMSYFESSYKGLTAPSQAGLVLAILMTAAMAAASPSFDTSFLSSEWSALNEIPASWLVRAQEITSPLLNQKLNLLLSGLSPKAEAMLEQVRIQSTDLLSNLDAASQQVQSVIGEQTVQLQFAWTSLLDIAKEKTTELQEILKVQASQLEARSSTVVERMQMTTASRLAESQAIYEKLSNDLIIKGSKVVENTMLQASKSGAHIERSVMEVAEEFRSSVLRKADYAVAQLEQSLSSIQARVDENLSREGPAIRAELERYILSPIQSEVTRELASLKAGALSTSANLQAVHETASARFDTILLKMSQNMVDFFAESKGYLADGTKWAKDSAHTAFVTLQHGLASKATEYRDVAIPRAREGIAFFEDAIITKTKDLESQLLSATEQFDTVAATHIADARSMYKQMSAEVTTKTFQANENIMLSYGAITEEAFKFQAFVNSKSTEIVQADIPLVKEGIVAALRNVKAVISFATSNLHYSIQVSQMQEGETHNLANLAESGVDYVRAVSRKLPTILNGDLSSFTVQSAAQAIEFPSPQDAAAKITPGESLSSQYDRLQNILFNSM